jgi:DNA polymerase V
MNFYFPTVFIPLVSGTVSAGFPSPADDYTELSLDLNSHLVDSPYTTFCIRVCGNSMEGDRMYDGDMVPVDRSLAAQNGNIIIGALDGEFTVKRLRIEQG